MRVVLPFFAAEIEVRIAPSTTAATLVVRAVLLLETLVARPPLEHRPVHAEVLVRSQPRFPGLRPRLPQESTARISRPKPPPVLAEATLAPNPLAPFPAD